MLIPNTMAVPYFGVIGNHDLYRWEDYRRRLLKQLRRADAESACRGDYGVNSVCFYKGILFVLSGVGTRGDRHAEFIEQAFKQNPGAQWKVCVWHKNNEFYQVGNKADEVGFDVYEACRRHGAMIMTGHEHSYARTMTMTSFEKHTLLDENPRNITLAPGNGYSVLAGLGGVGMRFWNPKMAKSPWWAAVGAINNDFDFGAVLCEFRNRGERTADCQFRDIRRRVLDEWRLTTSVRTNRRSLVEDQESPDSRQCWHKFESQVRYGDDLVLSAHPNPVAIQLSQSTNLLGAAMGRFSPKFTEPPQATMKFYFRDVIPKGSVVARAFLQLYALSSGEGEARVRVRVDRSTATDNADQPTVLWTLNKETADNDLWGKGEVVVSSDLSALVQRLVDADDVAELVVTLDLMDTDGVAGDFLVHGYGDQPCLAPSLLIETNSCIA
jgi:hypothetical protein